jgi:uncharacterized protein GlcG (DUF336 family)
MHDDDHLLREQLRRIDPARDLAPQPPTWLSHRMEQIMTDSTGTVAAPARKRGLWIAAAAAALAVGAAVVVPLALAGAPTTEVLALPHDGGITTGSCLPVTPEGLSSQEKAFAANAIAVDGDTVTLEVTERFAGEVADRVEVTQLDAIDSDFSSVSFEVGGSYLVAAGDGLVRGCGLSGTDSPELRAVYDAAFGD